MDDVSHHLALCASLRFWYLGAQVRSGVNAGGQAVAASGSISVPAPGTTASAIVPSLVASTTYDVWVVAQDDEITPNLQTNPVSVVLTTGPDTTAPAWLGGFPLLADVQDVSFTVQVQMSEAGTWYFVVVLAGATAPSTAEVKGGTDGSGAPGIAAGSKTAAAAVTSTRVVSTGVQPSTTYDVWVVAEDDEATPNPQTAPAKLVAAMLADGSPPSFLATFPRATGIQDFSFDVEVQLDEPGTW